MTMFDQMLAGGYSYSSNIIDSQFTFNDHLCAHGSYVSNELLTVILKTVLV